MRNLRSAANRRWRRGFSGLFAAVVFTGLGASALAQKPSSQRPVAKKPAASKSAPPGKAEPKQPPPKAEPSAAEPKPSPAPSASDDLYEGPARPLPKLPALPPKAGTPNVLAAPISPGSKFADAWASEYRKAEADLELTEENANRADAMAEFLRASAADERGDADEALDGWKRAAQLDPANPELAIKVAFELAKRNEPGEAIRVLKDTIAIAPREPKPLIYLSQIYSKHLNKPELAVQTAQKAVEVAPDDFLAWAAVYEAHEAAGEGKKAAALIERAAESTSKNPEFWMQLGRFLHKLHMDRQTGAIAKDGQKPMTAVYQRIAELGPNDAAALTSAGDFFTLLREHVRAADLYDRAIKLNQPARDAATKNLREKHIRALIGAGRKAEALPLLDEFARDPSQSLRTDLSQWLGELYLQAGQADKAIEHLKQTLILDVSDADNHIALASLQMRAKKFDDAVATMAAAVKKFPNQIEASFSYAVMLSRAKRHVEALGVLQKVKDDAKGREDSTLSWRFYSQWGYIASEAGKLDQAAEYYKKAIELDPEEPQPYNDLGYLWVEKGINIEEAGAMIKKAVEMAPKTAAYLDSLGWYYYKTGKFEDAKRELLAALDAMEGEGDPVMYDHLGDAYEALGNHREAINQWEKALKLEPEDAEKLRSKVQAAKKK
jgi:tetratricopeptide (TPR) repeat protein